MVFCLGGILLGLLFFLVLSSTLRLHSRVSPWVDGSCCSRATRGTTDGTVSTTSSSRPLVRNGYPAPQDIRGTREVQVLREGNALQEHCNDGLAGVGDVGCPSLAGRHCARDLHRRDPEQLRPRRVEDVRCPSLASRHYARDSHHWSPEQVQPRRG